MALQSIPAGSDYSCEIPKAIKSCEIFLLILSEDSQVSSWVQKELDNAINEGKFIISFHKDESNLKDVFNFMLSNVQRIEEFNRLSDAYKQLIDKITSFDDKKRRRLTKRTHVRFPLIQSLEEIILWQKRQILISHIEKAR